MWRFFYPLRWLRRKKKNGDAAVAVAALQDATKKEVLEHAKALYRQGVWVRDLHADEVASDTPEIEVEPMGNYPG